MTKKNKSVLGVGKDEMNLAEFPICTLNRLDKRNVIEYIREYRNKDGNVEYQKWAVRGAAGLPTEFADRVLVALITLSAAEGFKSRRLSFTVYGVLKILGLKINQKGYRRVEKALQELQGVQIHSEGAFWDAQGKRRIVGFIGIIRNVWLHYLSSDGAIEKEDGKSYLEWDDLIWENFQTGYVKTIDHKYYFETLTKPVSRVLYRFLDKRMHYNKTGTYSITVWALAPALNMAEQPNPSRYKRMLKPALDELVSTEFLAGYEFKKDWVYFYKKLRQEQVQPPLFDDNSGPTVQEELTGLDLIWHNVCDQLMSTMQEDLVTRWLLPANLRSIEKGVATIDVPAAGIDWLKNQLHRQLLTELNLQWDAERITDLSLQPFVVADIETSENA